MHCRLAFSFGLLASRGHLHARWPTELPSAEASKMDEIGKALRKAATTVGAARDYLRVELPPKPACPSSPSKTLAPGRGVDREELHTAGHAIDRGRHWDSRRCHGVSWSLGKLFLRTGLSGLWRQDPERSPR